MDALGMGASAIAAMTAKPAGSARAGVLLLAPSGGLGGGIERYVATLEWAFGAEGVPCMRVSLSQPGPAGHLRLLEEASRLCRRRPPGLRIIAAHRALLPVAMMLRARHGANGICVLCHGSDVWGRALSPRWRLERRAMHSSHVRVVAVSSFTAGAVDVGARATVLGPGLSRPWYDTLLKAAACARQPSNKLRLVTAFRLGDWRDKGLPELLAAVRLLDLPGLFLTICGSGPVPAELRYEIRGAPWCRIRSDATDAELAAELADADLFVLATRTRTGRRPCGEGFGLVLAEAQLAGTPVVGPASGGSRDAYLDGVTGTAPLDESADALAQTLRALLKDREKLAKMSAAAAQWAHARYDPGLYSAQAVRRLL
jgi:phosphatidyl-myo-inositol dimannoside synthase